jgi:HEAT repeat protein
MRTTLSLIPRGLLIAGVTLLSLANLSAFAADSNIDAAKEKELIAILRSEAPPADKALACKKLAVDGSAAAVEDLAKLLPDAQLSSWARIALEAIPGPEADAALRAAAEKLEGRLLVGMLNSIGVRRDAGSVEVLIKRLGEKDADAASAAAVALGRVGNDAAAKALQGALATAEGSVRSAVAEGCILCAERFHAAGNAASAVALYDAVRKANVPQQRVLEATRGAILARNQEGLPLLMEQLQSSNTKAFQMGLFTAREFPGTAVDKALASELAQAPADRAALLIPAMADRPQTGALAAILKAAGAGPKPVRLAAITALARVGDATCLPALLEAAGDADAELAAAAKGTIADLPGDKINEQIAALLPKSEGKTFAMLVELVGQRRIEATPALLKALDSNDKAIRAAALTALGETVSPKQLSVLITNAIAPKHADDAAIAQQALKAASVRMPDREACATELAAAYDRATNVAIKGPSAGRRLSPSLAPRPRPTTLRCKKPARSCWANGRRSTRFRCSWT